MHEIETHTSANGDVLAAAAYAVRPAWHGLGTVTDAGMTITEGMDLAHMSGWNLRKLPATGQEPITDADGFPAGVATVACPGSYVVTRTNPFTGAPEGLATVGEDWTPLQNEATAEFLAEVVGQGDARLDTIGSLDGGRRTFVTMSLPGDVLVGGVDPVRMFLACLNGHDGRHAFRTVVTPVRIVCANTERAAMAHNSGIYKVNHTAKIAASAVEARKALDLTLAYRDEFTAAVDRMINTPMSVGAFRVEAKKILRPAGKEVSERSEKADAKLLNHLTALFSGPLNAGITGTRWAAYNAFTDHLDHHAPVQAKGERPDRVRARRALLGGADDTKTRAFRAFAVPA